MRIVLMSLSAAAIAALMSHVPTVASTTAAPPPCSVSGAKFPELMPEHYVWEVYFRNLTAVASGKIEGVTPPQGKQFHPDIVNNNARYMGLSESRALDFPRSGRQGH